MKPYIVFEGIVGSGKSTQARKLYNFLNEKYKGKVILTREPGGSEIADSIRNVAQGTKYKEEMIPITEVYLYAASRAQTLKTIVLPNIKNNKIVIADRSFLSSLAFQGYGREIGFEKVLELNKPALIILPGLVFYIDLPPEIGLKRANDKQGDKFESLDIEFHNRVREGYKEISRLDYLRNRWITIDGTKKIEVIFNEIKIQTIEFLKKFNL